MATSTYALDRKGTVISIGIIGLMFFVFGFVSWVNAILIPYFRIACELTNFQSYLVAFAFYISYLVMSMPSSYLLKRVGYKKGIVTGFWIMARSEERRVGKACRSRRAAWSYEERRSRR